MAMEVRRVVTTNDESGKSVVLIDGVTPYRASRRRGHDSRLVWTTAGGEPPNTGNEDAGAREVGRPPPPGGTIFRVLEIQPDQELEMHTTDTIDYVVIIEGELYAVLDDTEVLLKAGDCLVQRGTRHGWNNRSDRACRLAAVLIDAAR